MEEIKLTGRLLEIAGRIQPCGVMADIGCDHGLIACYAAQEGLAKKIYAVDISEGSLSKAAELARAAGLDAAASAGVVSRQGVVECIRGDGFGPIPENVHTAVIAGMGGLEILSILSSAASRLSERLILCPHTKQRELREGLYRFGFDIVYDKKCLDAGKFYDIIEAKPTSGFRLLSEYALEFGMTNIAFLKSGGTPDAVFKEYLSGQRTLVEAVPKGKRSPALARKLEMINNLLQR